MARSAGAMGMPGSATAGLPGPTTRGMPGPATAGVLPGPATAVVQARTVFSASSFKTHRHIWTDFSHDLFGPVTS